MRNDFSQPRRRWVPAIPWGAFAIGFVVLAIFAAAVVGGISYASTRGTQENCEVTDKDHTVQVSGDSESTTSTDVWTIYSSCGVLQVQDNWFLGVFSAAEVYGSIKTGSTYDFETVGWRNNFLGWYPSITKATEVTQ